MPSLPLWLICRYRWDYKVFISYDSIESGWDDDFFAEVNIKWSDGVGGYNVWMPPKKQYSREIPCNLLVLVLCTRKYILQKIPGKLGNIIWGTTLYCGTRENRRYRRLQLVLLLLLLLFVFLWRVARKWDRDIACSYISTREYFLFFFLRATDTRDGRGKGPVVGLSGNSLTNEYFSCPSRTDDAVTPLCCSEKY